MAAVSRRTLVQHNHSPGWRSGPQTSSCSPHTNRWGARSSLRCALPRPCLLRLALSTATHQTGCGGSACSHLRSCARSTRRAAERSNSSRPFHNCSSSQRCYSHRARRSIPPVAPPRVMKGRRRAEMTTSSRPFGSWRRSRCCSSRRVRRSIPPEASPRAMKGRRRAEMTTSSRPS